MEVLRLLASQCADSVINEGDGMMKRDFLYRFYLTAMTLFLAMSSFAQDIQIGAKGGFDLTSMEFSSGDLNKSNRAGFFIGPTMRIDTPVMGLSIDVSALYDQRNVKVGTRTLTQESLVVPAHARFGVSIGDLLGVFVCAGPQLSYNLGKSSFQWEDIDQYRKHFTFQETTLSINLGAGAKFGGNLEGAIYYNVPLGKTADFTWDTLASELQDLDMHTAKSRTNSWRISVSYYF